MRTAIGALERPRKLIVSRLQAIIPKESGFRFLRLGATSKAIVTLDAAVCVSAVVILAVLANHFD